MDYWYIWFPSALLILFAVYLFLIAPRSKRALSLPKFGYAHRGLWDADRPENSLSAFQAAVDSGYGIEADVRLTRDGVAVMMHDNDLARVSGAAGKVSELTYSELQEFRIGGKEKIPTLVEMLELVDGRVPLLIELKGETKDTSICDIVAPILDSYKGEFVVESFNPVLLQRMKKLRPEIRRGQLTSKLQDGEKKRTLAAILFLMLTNLLSRPDFIAYRKGFSKNPSLVLISWIFGVRRCVWTVKSLDEYNSLIARGDCPIFDSIPPEDRARFQPLK